MLPLGLFATSLLLLTSGSLAGAFTFSFGSPNECESLNISWMGGTPPFHLLIIPVFGITQNVTIPPEAYSFGRGTYQTQLALPKGKRFLLSMGDAVGEDSGGTSTVLTVGESLGTSCNTTETDIGFFFQLNTVLAQCRTMTFEGYDKAVQPVRILGLVPGGDMITLNPPMGAKTYDWTADVSAGTSMIFLMVDAQNRQGGTSNLFTTAETGSSDCLSNDSPASTNNPPSLTATPTGSQFASASESKSISATSSPSDSPSSSPPVHRISTGLIAGIAAGAFILLALLAALVLFCIKRRRRTTQAGSSSQLDERWHKMNNVDLLVQPFIYEPPPSMPHRLPYGQPHSYSSASSAQDFGARADGPQDGSFIGSSLGQDYTTGSHALSTQSRGSFAPDLGSYHSVPSSPPESTAVGTSTRQSRASAGVLSASESLNHESRGSRYIIHTDIEDDPNADSVIELPPQYSERRVRPLRGVEAASPTSPSLSQRWSSGGATDPFGVAPLPRKSSRMKGLHGQPDPLVPRNPS